MYYLVSFIKSLFLLFVNTVHSYGISIIFLSIAVTVFLTPFYYLTGILEKREKNTRERLEPFIERINKIKDSQIRHKHMQKLYKSFKYSPIYSLRSLSSLLIQIPFFIAAYEMLKHFEGLRGVSFLFINDLGEPDKILGGVNLLPIMMTLINFAAAIFMTWGAQSKERIQSYIIAIFFLVLLYMSPSGLVLYWTFNNLINMIRYFIIWIRKNAFSTLFNSIFNFVKTLVGDGAKWTSAFIFCSILYCSINIAASGYFYEKVSYFNAFLLYPLYFLVLIKTYSFIQTNLLTNISKFTKQISFYFRVENNFLLKTSILLLLFVISFFVYRYESWHYLLGILLLIPIFLKSITFDKFKEILKRNIVFAVLIMLFPAILYYKSNFAYFSGDEIITYAIVLFSFAILFPIFVWIFNGEFLPKEIDILSLSFLSAAMFLPIVRDWTRYSGDTPIDFVFFFAITMFIAKLIIKYKKLIMIFLLSSSLFITVLPIKDTYTHKESTQLQTIVPNDLLRLKMKETPNIFLFMHDAFPRKDLVARYEKEYGVNMMGEYEEMEKMLKENGFEIYNVYSITNSTLGTMAGVFEMYRSVRSFVNESGLARAVAGDSIVNILLQKSGYDTGMADRSLSSTVKRAGLVESFYNKKWIIDDSQESIVVKGIMQGNLDTMKFKEVNVSVNSGLYDIISQMTQKDKNFIWQVLGPGHGALGKIGDFRKDFDVWLPEYFIAISDIKDEIKLTMEKYPDAIIIFMSDHGPWLLGDHTKAYNTVAEKDIDEIFFRDSFGAFMAIHWPDKQRAGKYDKDFDVTQDLFSVIFAYLFDSSEPLKYEIKDTAVRLKDHKFDKGKFYPYFYKEGEQK
ncbi:MAG: membrane protein insertase YidC [Elusimicrobiota bacterium]|jgi:YidC/Oxa1 family membrane protein insertase|nr:membrane protein insertase YidC [Elusimicrobiota bacterium]